MNIEGLAKRLKLSPATVSRALHPSTEHKVEAETRLRIQELASKYRYVPNISARNLVCKKSNVIGVVIPYSPAIFCSEYYMQLLSGIADGIRETYYNFNLFLVRSDERKTVRHFLRAKAVAGVILSHWTFFSDSIKEIETLGIPTLGINEAVPSKKMNFLTCDNFQGAKEAVGFLLRQGHEKIGMLLGPSNSVDSQERFNGYKAALKNQGIAVQRNWMIQAGRFEREAGYRAMKEALEQGSEVTAYFCANDEIAIGALKAVKEKGLNCPENISLIGFDGLKIGEYVDPPITSVEQAVYELGKRGARVLINLIEGREKGPFVKKIPCQLVIRQSCVAPKGALAHR